MSATAIVQYVGFEAKVLVRSYNFVVRESTTETRDFTLTILNEAFSSHRLSFQDAPDLCSLKLHRELAAFENHPPHTHYRISEVELDDYRDSHKRKSAGKLYTPRLAREIQPGGGTGRG